MSELNDIYNVALLYEKKIIKKKTKKRDLDKEMEMRREAQDQAEESKKTGADQYDDVKKPYSESRYINEWDKMITICENINNIV